MPDPRQLLLGLFQTFLWKEKSMSATCLRRLVRKMEHDGWLRDSSGRAKRGARFWVELDKSGNLASIFVSIDSDQPWWLVLLVKNRNCNDVNRQYCHPSFGMSRNWYRKTSIVSANLNQYPACFPRTNQMSFAYLLRNKHKRASLFQLSKPRNG